MIYQIHSSFVASIKEFKTDPIATVEGAKGEPLCILNKNQPAFYCLSPQLYKSIFDALEDTQIKKIFSTRLVKIVGTFKNI